MVDNKVLLDNATVRNALIALEMLPGKNGPNSTQVFDMQLLALSNLIDAILLHDQIVIPALHGTDYPPTIDIVNQLLGAEVLTPLNVSDADMSKINRIAVDDFEEWPVATHQSLSILHEAVGTKSRVDAWDKVIRGKYSERIVRHLTYSSLSSVDLEGGTDMEGVYDIAAHFGVRNAEAPRNYPAHLNVDSAGEEIHIAVLWLAFRTCVYDIISWITGIPYYPHPLRSELWRTINLRRSSPQAFFELPDTTLRSARKTIGRQINETMGLQQYDLDLPPFLTFVIRLATSPSDILSVTKELREVGAVVKLRDYLNQMQSVLEDTDWVERVQELRGEFEGLTHDLVVEYHGAALPKVPVSFQVVGIKVGGGISIPSQLHSLGLKVKYLRRPHLGFLRDVFKSISVVWGLSDLYDKLFFGGGERVYATVRIDNREYSVIDKLRTKATRYLSKSSRRGTRIASFVLFDIEHLDEINNRYGREGGDQVVEAVETVLLGETRSGKLEISREAGDTFVVLVLGQPPTYAYKWATGVKTRIEKLPLRLYPKIQSTAKAEKVRISVHIAASNAYRPDQVDTAFSAAIKKLKEN